MCEPAARAPVQAVLASDGQRITRTASGPKTSVVATCGDWPWCLLQDVVFPCEFSAVATIFVQAEETPESILGRKAGTPDNGLTASSQARVLAVLKPQIPCGTIMDGCVGDAAGEGPRRYHEVGGVWHALRHHAYHEEVAE